jgi:parvulin-like peptidyl-prolyl isomerase
MVESTLNSIRDDEAIVFMGDFLRAQPEPAMSLEAMPVLSGTELRREISHTAMIDGTAPFDSILDRSVAAKRQMILLRHHAEAGGFYNNEELLSQRQRRLEQALVEAYLQEMIVPRIVFNRQEFQSYYEENEDLFRGPDQVRMDMVVVDDKDSADEMSLRLSEGADFDFLRSQYLGDDADANGSVRWVSEGVFSGSIQEELRSLESGECSKPMDSRGRWLIVKLLGRRKGAARPLAEVEMQIREIMFQRKFTELLDEHIALLKERSEIRMNQEAIDEYFGQGS